MSENKPAISKQEKKRINLLAAAVIVCSIAVIVLVILKFARVISIDAYMPAAALVLFLQSCMFWKRARGLALFQLGVGVFSILVFCITTFVL